MLICFSGKKEASNQKTLQFSSFSGKGKSSTRKMVLSDSWFYLGAFSGKKEALNQKTLSNIVLSKFLLWEKRSLKPENPPIWCYLDNFSPERRPSVKTRETLQVGSEYLKQKLSISVVKTSYFTLYLILDQHFRFRLQFVLSFRSLVVYLKHVPTENTKRTISMLQRSITFFLHFEVE